MCLISFLMSSEQSCNFSPTSSMKGLSLDHSTTKMNLKMKLDYSRNCIFPSVVGNIRHSKKDVSHGTS
jgi:hypothetical protein